MHPNKPHPHHNTFGSMIENRSWSAGSRYRFGFNGMEDDAEILGEGNTLKFEARIYDSRLGRFLTIDPLINENPWNSPYLFADNTPIMFIDKNGESGDLPKSAKGYNGKEKVKINHVSSQTVVSSITTYIKSINSNNKISGNVNEVFDFNRYVKKGYFEKIYDEYFYDDKSEYKIENALNSTGQGINEYRGNIKIGDSNIKVGVVMSAAQNNLFEYAWASEFVAEPVKVTKERMNLRTKELTTTYQLKFQQYNKERGTYQSSSFNVILEFETLEDRELFLKEYIEEVSEDSKTKNKEKTGNE